MRRIHEYENLGKNLTEISKHSTKEVMVINMLLTIITGTDQ
jgi:hypothetical protein